MRGMTPTPADPVTPATTIMLREMSRRPYGEFYGKALAAATGMKPAVLYRLLNRLESVGWLTSDMVPTDSLTGGAPRRVYRFTDAGRNHVAARF